VRSQKFGGGSPKPCSANLKICSAVAVLSEPKGLRPGIFRTTPAPPSRRDRADRGAFRVDRDDALGGHPEVATVIRQARSGFDGGQSAGLHGNDPLDANAAAHEISLRDKPGVATQSIGEEPNRRVVVLPRNV
jgi:hypothetical protein